MSHDLSGLRSIAYRRGAISSRVAQWPPAELRTWVNERLVAARSGNAEARTTLVAWTHAMACDADTALRLRSLDRGLDTARDLEPLTHAFLRATAAPSQSRRLPWRARPGGDEHPMQVLRGCFGPYDVIEPVEIDRTLLPFPDHPWLDGMHEDDVFALDEEEHAALWNAWRRRGTTWRRRRVPGRPPWGRRFHRAAVRHPSLALRRYFLSLPTLTERDVVAMAVLRPTRAGLLLAIAQSDRWMSRRSVREALLGNPYTPSWLVAGLLPTASPSRVREHARHHDAPVVMDLARALLAHG